MADDTDLPAALLDRVFRVLYGPEERRDGDLRALCADHPEHAASIRRHLEASETAKRTADQEQDESGPTRWLRLWSLAPGTTFGSYRIVEVLGSGGMGTVFAATRSSDDATVALKILHPTVLRQPNARVRFVREAKVLARLRHPRICELLDFGEVEGCPFLVLRLVHGPTLSECIAAARRLGDTENFGDRLLADEWRSSLLAEADGCAVPRNLGATLRLLELLAEALHAAHRHGVVHRDVKPGNVMLDADGRPVLVDFGLATHRSHDTLTAPGDLLGTPAYMPPERVRRSDEEPDEQGDVYSLGAVLFECLTLRTPFVAGSHGELLAAIANTTPPALRDLRPDVPVDLETVVATALARDLRTRYATAADLAADLGRVRRGEPVKARRPSWLALVVDFATRNRMFTAITLMAAFATTLLSTLASMARAEQRDADLLSSSAIVAMAHAAEQELWPATPDKEERFVAWLQRYAAPGDSSALPERLLRLEAACGCSARAALAYDRAQRFAIERQRLQDELGSIQQLVPVDRPESMPPEELEQFKLRRAEWLRIELARTPESSAVIPTGSTAHFAALLETARYVLDSAEIPDRPGAIARVSQTLARLRSPPTVESPDAWRAVRDAVANGQAPYRQAIELVPQRGLVPLGPDPTSDLQEFAVIGSGTVPVRDPAGRLSSTTDAAIVLVLLPGGITTIGTGHIDFGADAMAFPPHGVKLEPFFLAKYETTNRQWRTLGGGTPSRMAPGDQFFGEHIGDAHPVESVALPECREVMRWHGLVLPTEAQWEYAARAGLSEATAAALARERNRDNTAMDWNRPMPPFVSDDGWDGHLLTTAVGSWPANGFGLHDMGGNVSEWCDDLFGLYCFPPRAHDGRRLTTWGDRGVGRGANFMINTRLHHRIPVPPGLRLPILGVRAARRVET
jgi:serine/threonine protein kinase/formylglycine-generating enzyme required for sulfatase activity